MEAETPRPLTKEERAVLDFLLTAEFPGVEALREQALHAKESGGKACPCGCPSFGLTVDRSLAEPALLTVALPVIASASYVYPDGSASGDLLLFQATRQPGWLGGVEVTWYGDEPPLTLPPPSLCDPPKPDPKAALRFIPPFADASTTGPGSGSGTGSTPRFSDISRGVPEHRPAGRTADGEGHAVAGDRAQRVQG